MVTDGLTAATRASSTGPESTAERAVISDGSPRGTGSLSQEAIAAMSDLLQSLDPTAPSPDPRADADDHGEPELTQAQCIDLLRELEDLKSAASGAQVALTA